MDNALENFLEIIKKDPLFAAEGMDIENAEFALMDLDKGLAELEGVWRPGNRWFFLRYPMEKTLHPVDFLREFVKAEKMRHKFLEAPSRRSAKELLSQYEKTRKAYLRGAANYCKALRVARKIGKFPADAVFQFFHREITLREIWRIFDLFSENAEILGKEIKLREDILAGKKTFIASEMPAAEISEEVSGSGLSPRHRKILETLEKQHPYRERLGPIFYSLPNFDGSGKTHQFFAYILNTGRKGNFSLRLADQYYCFDINGDQKKSYDKTPYEPLEKRNIKYWLQPPTAWYASFDLTYYADIATICDLRRRGSELSRELVCAQRSSLFDLILETGADGAHYYAVMSRFMAKKGKLPPLFFLYLTRGCPSLYFLPFNRSVWRLREKLDFLGAKINKSSQFKNFDKIADGLTDSEIGEIARGGEYRHKAYVMPS